MSALWRLRVGLLVLFFGEGVCHDLIRAAE